MAIEIIVVSVIYQIDVAAVYTQIDGKSDAVDIYRRGACYRAAVDGDIAACFDNIAVNALYVRGITAQAVKVHLVCIIITIDSHVTRSIDAVCARIRLLDAAVKQKLCGRTLSDAQCHIGVL